MFKTFPSLPLPSGERDRVRGNEIKLGLREQWHNRVKRK